MNTEETDRERLIAFAKDLRARARRSSYGNLAKIAALVGVHKSLPYVASSQSTIKRLLSNEGGKGRRRNHYWFNACLVLLEYSAEDVLAVNPELGFSGAQEFLRRGREYLERRKTEVPHKPAEPLVTKEALDFLEKILSNLGQIDVRHACLVLLSILKIPQADSNNLTTTVVTENDLPTLRHLVSLPNGITPSRLFESLQLIKRG